MAFLGIPYAKVERFMPPQPVKKWKGVRACDHWGPMTMQPTNRPMTEEQMSEQCCVLNVWTTDVKAKKPVMFWLHGGGFDSGTSEWDPGMQLAKKDVVVVGINHRLNILGFLDLSTCGKKYKYSGNVDMLDAVAALEWVRDNIERFGGDPNNVTIFGESGGGGKVDTLMCMPKAKGLFHKAIIMSGTILNVNTKAMTEELGEVMLKELGIDKKNVDKIKDVPYKDLYAAGQRAMAASIGTRRPGTPMMWGFGPTPDGETLLQQPFQPDFASISDDIPLMKTIITADAITKKRQAPTYMYMFTWRSPLNNGSIHGHELKFCFNTLHRAKNDLPSPTADDLLLADKMSSVWAQFAHSGKPNIDALPVWQPYTAENGELMVFDYNCRIRHNPDRPLEEIINRHCFKQLDAFNAKKK